MLQIPLIHSWPLSHKTRRPSFQPEILALKHESRILGQWSNPVSGSRKSSQFSVGKTAQSLTSSVIEKPHTGFDECQIILLSCFRARNSAVRPRPSVRPSGRLDRLPKRLSRFHSPLHSRFLSGRGGPFLSWGFRIEAFLALFISFGKLEMSSTVILQPHSRLAILWVAWI